MVTTELREVVDALSVEERFSLLEYIERTTDVGDIALTEEELAILDRRDAEMDAVPSIGIPADELFRRIRSRLQ